jgi:SpoVK/Ycf46/Vps4 family AAA+-type ATPase
MDIDSSVNKRKNTYSNNKGHPPKKLKTDDDIIKLILNGGDDSDSDDESPILITKCTNPLCDHKPFPKGEMVKTVDVPKEINTIEDLITLGKTYHCKRNVSYCGLDLLVLCNLVEPLTKLSKMVGMKNVKENMVNQIVFFLQGLDKREKCGECMECICGKACTRLGDDNMKHCCIYGGPGLGKTELGKIMGNIYIALGLLEPGAEFMVAKRSDLIGKYLGHTAKITTDYFNKKNKEGNISKIVFLDEFYALGDTENRDSFSKECLDTINQILSEDKSKILVIVAGYKDAIEKCIFPVNQGLARRFPFVYELDKYTAEELKEIFLLKIKNSNWTINVDMDKLSDFFQAHHSYFPFYGGDIETFVLKCKIVHGKRVLYNQKEKKMLTMEDINKGFEMFKIHRVEKPSDMDDLDYDGIYMSED